MIPIDKYRERLLAERRAIFAQVAQVEDDLRWLDDDVEPELEEEGQEENIARLLAQLDDRGKAEIEAIDRALARIAQGDYGHCETCGEVIPAARLEALPAALMCVGCATARERARS